MKRFVSILLLLSQIYSSESFCADVRIQGAREASLEMGVPEDVARYIISGQYEYGIQFSERILITHLLPATYATTPDVCFSLGQQISGLVYLWFVKGKDHLSHGMKISDLFLQTIEIASRTCSVKIVGLNELSKISDEFELIDKLTAIARLTFLARNGWEYFYEVSLTLDQCLIAGIQDGVVFLYSPGGFFQGSKMLDYRNDIYFSTEWVMSRGEYFASKVRVREQCKNKRFSLEPSRIVQEVKIVP